MPLVISTGMSSTTEVSDAVSIASSYHKRLVLMHCISAYPPQLEDLNLRVIPRLTQLFQLPVGYSSHDRTNLPVIAAVALGACAVERHFTLSRKMRGSDQAISLDPSAFQKMVEQIRGIEQALGEERKVLPSERPFREKLAKGIVAAKHLAEGHVLGEQDLAFKSPARGLPPSMMSHILGKKLRRALQPDEYVLVEDLGDQ